METQRVPEALAPITRQPTPSSFGEELRRLRELRNMSAADLGKHLATSSTSIVRIERGERFPRRRVVIELARALNCDANRLMDLCDASTAARDETKRQRRAQLAGGYETSPPLDPRLGLGWFVGRAREKKGLSQSELQRRCGMSNGYLRVVERGDVYPANVWLEQLSAQLNVSLAELQRLRDQARAANTARLEQRKQRQKEARLQSSDGAGAEATLGSAP